MRGLNECQTRLGLNLTVYSIIVSFKQLKIIGHRNLFCGSQDPTMRNHRRFVLFKIKQKHENRLKN